MSDPTSTQTPNSNPLVETNLHTLENPGAPGKPTIGDADVNLNLVIGFTGGQFTINGAVFTPPTAPVLLQILSGARTADELLPPGSVYTLPRNAVVEVSIPGGSIGAPVSTPNVLPGMLLINPFPSILSIYTVYVLSYDVVLFLIFS